jgi:D-3-phosphoglycerate dehydrogenase
VGAVELDPWPNLKVLSLAFTGYNDVALDLCREKGLTVYYVPGYSTDSVAELTIGLTLAVLRRIPYANGRVCSGHWDRGDVMPGVELAGRTVGILGTGTIGRRSAEIFKVFGCKLLGWSRTRRNDFPGTYEDDVSAVFAKSDVIALHLPVNDATRGIASREMIARMPGTSILVNTSRADLVDTQALADAIREGRIAGAAVDVYDLEPPDLQKNPLFYLNDRNVILTPHLGFKTAESLRRLAEMTISNIGRDPNPENRLLPDI